MALEQHAAMMKKFPGMEHAEPYMAHVDPGARGEIGWTFTQPGEYLYRCLVPGHFEAGMVGRVRGAVNGIGVANEIADRAGHRT